MKSLQSSIENRSSIVDGIRLSKADCMLFKHNDMSNLATLLEKNRASYDTVLIITESVFSMDGDFADIQALASHGAYVLTSRVLKNYLINHMRSLLYTTALPPVAVNWNRFIIQHMNNFSKNRKKLFKVSDAFRNALKKKNIPFLGQSHIIPVVTKSNAKAVELSLLLMDHGFLAFPIRPPTVPENQSRIRFSLTSDIEYKDIEKVPDLILSCLR